MASDLLVFAPLRIEAAVLRKAPGWTILRTGMGPARARIAAARGLAVESRAVAIVGVCAAIAPELRAGDVVCATELRRAGGAPSPVPANALLVTALRRRGLRVHVGPIVSVDRITSPDARRLLAGGGALAVDMESAWLADATDGRPLAVVRVVVEASGRSLRDPRTLVAGAQALRTLRRASGALAEWARLAEVAGRDETRAYLVDDEGDADVAPREVRPA